MAIAQVMAGRIRLRRLSAFICKRAGIVEAQIHQSGSWSRCQHERRIGDVSIDDRPQVTKRHVAAGRRKSRIDDVRKHHPADIMIVTVTHLVIDAAVARPIARLPAENPSSRVPDALLPYDATIIAPSFDTESAIPLSANWGGASPISRPTASAGAIGIRTYL